MFSHPSFRYGGAQPPLPHHDQAHFYGAPDISLGLSGEPAALPAGAKGYFCGFDSLKASKLGSPRSFSNVLVSGQEGSLEIFGVARTGLEKIASLVELRGGVVNAKILPWTMDLQACSTYPWIVVVIQGPVLPGRERPEHANDQDDMTAQTLPGNPCEGTHEHRQTLPSAGVKHYQTSVEVYSLSTERHISTLLRLPEADRMLSTGSPLSPASPANGELALSADSGTLLVTSGKTGEVWIFKTNGIEPALKCAGKIWAAVEQVPGREAISAVGPDSVDQHNTNLRPVMPSANSAIVSLTGRWLAYSPSLSTSPTSLGADIPDDVCSTKMPGVNTYVPPQPPAVNCSTDAPDTQKLLGQLGRIVTQEFVKGAKWVGEQGYQAWNNYWNKPAPGQPAGSPPMRWPAPDRAAQQPAQYPPTHGEGIPANLIVPEPTLVCIIDLEKLANTRTISSSSPPHPLITFKNPLGCSFISFAPSGLALFTASGKGDVQIVWDLMQILYTKSSLLQPRRRSEPSGPRVRQVAIFTRLTAARIVDVVWTSPQGSRIAMITEHNTIHLRELPQSAFSWPPPRKRGSKHEEDIVPVESHELLNPSSTVASSALTAVKGFATLATAVRAKAHNGLNRQPITARGVTTTVGQGLAAGVSKSLGAATGTFKNFRTAADSRLHLPQSSNILRAGSMKWLGTQRGDSLAVVNNGVISIYVLKTTSHAAKSEQGGYLSARPAMQLRIPSIPDVDLAPKLMRVLGHVDQMGDRQHHNPSAMTWKLGSATATAADASSGTESSIPHVEIESTAPYQPFHTDRRVGLYHMHTKNHSPQPDIEAQEKLLTASMLLAPHTTHQQGKRKKSKTSKLTSVDNGLHSDVVGASASSGTVSLVPEQDIYVFGGSILTTKLDVGVYEEEDEIDESSPTDADHHSIIMDRVTTRIDPEEQLIISTTRPRWSGRQGNADLEEDDEDYLVVDYKDQRV